MMTNLPLKEVKRQLRKKLKSNLKTVSQDSLIKQSHLIHQNLLNHEYFKTASNIAVFMNMPDLEVKTMEIIESCFTLDKSVYLPRCNYVSSPGRKSNYMSLLKMTSIEAVHQLQPQGKYQLLEPISGVDVMETGNLDLVIVPGVGFDKNKNRMGHGAGFYDEFITTFHNKFNKKPYLLGVALQEQIIDCIPTEPHDWKLDSIVTSTNVY